MTLNSDGHSPVGPPDPVKDVKSYQRVEFVESFEGEDGCVHGVPLVRGASSAATWMITRRPYSYSSMASKVSRTNLN